MMDYLTRLRTNQPCNKRVTIRNGEIQKRAGLPIAEAIAVTVHVPDVSALQALLSELSLDSNTVLVSGFVEGTEEGEPYVVMSRSLIEKATNESYEKGFVDIDGQRVIARFKTNFVPSSWLMIDRDKLEGLPDHLNPDDETSYIDMVDRIIPGFANAGRVRVPSTSSRVLVDGEPLFSDGVRYWFQISDSSAVEGLGARLKVRAASLDLAFMQPSARSERGVLSTVFDCSVFSPERLVYDGQPTVSGQGLSLADPKLEVSAGGRVDLSRIPAISSADQQRVQRQYGLTISNANQSCSFAVDGELRLDMPIETKEGSMTPRQFFESPAERIRCQATFRSSDSWNGALKKTAEGLPYLHDYGGCTLYYLGAEEKKELLRGQPKNWLTVQREVARSLAVRLEVDDASGYYDKTVVKQVIEGAFFSPAGRHYYLVNDLGGLIQFPQAEAKTNFEKRFDRLLDRSVRKRLAEIGKGAEKSFGETLKAAWAPIFSHIKHYQQRNRIEMLVDMFAEEGRIELLDESARVVYVHEPYQEGEIDEAIVADFKEHFLEFDTFLNYLVAALFAQDRKRAMLWLQASSDWGKTFVVSILSELGCAVELTVKETEACFEGRPVGKSMIDFKRAFVVVFEEFKSVKSEIKQLQNYLSLSPKNQLQQTVPLYSKLFLSAEGVPSLASDVGIEDQFANRFNFLKLEGNLTNRPKFQEAGRRAYFASCRNYVAKVFNEKIAEYRALGKEQAADLAEKEISHFRSEYGIDKFFTPLSSGLEDRGREFTDWLSRNYLSARETLKIHESKNRGYRSNPGLDGYVSKLPAVEREVWDNLKYHEDSQRWVLKNAPKLVETWIKASFDKSVRGMLGFKRDEIARAASGGSGSERLTICGERGRFTPMPYIDLEDDLLSDDLPNLTNVKQFTQQLRTGDGQGTAI